MNNDLISRSALMHEIEKYFRDSKALTDDALSLVCMMPAVDAVEVVRGKWEHLESGLHDLWRCTSCGDEWTFEYDPTDKETMVNFCPNCGADMREREGDDERT